MDLNVNSLAAAVGSSVKNVQFKTAAENVPRKILLIGNYDTTITTVQEDVPVRVFSAQEVGAKTGFGFMLHRLAIQAFTGSRGIETWFIAQAEDSGVEAAGTVLISGPATASGYLYFYVAGLRVVVNVLNADTQNDMRSKAVTAINADTSLPVTAAADVVDGQFILTAKNKGDFWGNNITVRTNIRAGEAYPAGVGVTLPPGSKLSGGTGTPDISTALDALGTDDDANLEFFTDVVHGYGQESTVLNSILSYVGEGNDFVGLYKKLVGRPFRVLSGDTAAGTNARDALIAIGNGRKLDRGNGVIAAPGSASHPSEIAAQAIGHMARINNIRAAENYVDTILTGIDPGPTESLGATTGRWTSVYDNRDAAVKAGISPTRYVNSNLVLQNVMTFYHPDDVPQESNGYASMRNISIVQNILHNIGMNFKREKWVGFSIVADTKNVTNITDKAKARDINTVIDDLVMLARLFESKAWLYSADFTIDKLKESDSVVIRPGGLGFDNKFRVILSGEGLILDTVTEFDINVAVAIS